MFLNPYSLFEINNYFHNNYICCAQGHMHELVFTQKMPYYFDNSVQL